MPPLVRLSRLSVHFPERGGSVFRRRFINAVSDIDLDIHPHDTFCLLGESGSGKTTLARAMLGLIPFHSGTIAYDGRIIRKTGDAAHKRLRTDSQMVFQSPTAALNPRLTLGQSIEEPLEAKGASRTERREAVLELARRAGLSPELLRRRPGEVSGGQNQRACIARALSTRPRLLILDEPLTALDAVAHRRIIVLLRQLKESFGPTYFLITHNLAMAGQVGTRVAVMYLGRIVEKAPAGAFFADPRHPYAEALLSSVLKPGFRRGGRIVLQGELPSLRHPPKGCVFHPRCPRRFEECDRTAPRPRRVGEGHTVCCHLFNDFPVDDFPIDELPAAGCAGEEAE